MVAIIDFLAGLHVPPVWVAVGFDAALKGSVLLVIAALVAGLLWRASAASRHMVWSIALAAHLLLPILSGILPQWNAAILPAGSPVLASWDDPSPAPPAPWGLMPDADPSMASALQSAAGSEAYRSRAGSSHDPGASWRLLTAIVWLGGVIAILLRLGAGTLQAARLARRAHRVTDPQWLASAQQVAAQLALRRPLTLLHGSQLGVPVTWGTLYPVILLPATAAGWDEERRRVVLIHEVAHVRRLDALVQLLSQLTLAFFWFNPLVWLAIRRIRIERERACDDYVLNAGTRPSEYVRHLVEIVRSLRRTSEPGCATLAMARRSEFEGRVCAVLDSGACRRGPGRAARAYAGAAALLLLLALASLRALPQAAAAAPVPGQVLPTLSTLPPLGLLSEHGAVPWPEGFQWSHQLAADYRWIGHLAPGEVIEVKGISGHVRAVPAGGDSVEILAQVTASRNGTSEVEFTAVRHLAGVTFCAVYPSPYPDRPNRCVPGDAAQNNRAGEVEAVHFIVRVPRGVGFVGRTVSGDVSADGLDASVGAHTISGNIDLAIPASGEASTVNGAIRAVTGPRWSSALSLRARNGGIQLHLAEGADARVGASLGSGTIRSEFALRQQQVAEDVRQAMGRLGNGRGEIEVELINGDIAILRHPR